MQIQSPFQINCDIQNYRTFADYFFATTAEYGTRLAMVGFSYFLQSKQQNALFRQTSRGKSRN